MINRPTFKTRYRVGVVEREGVLVAGEEAYTVLGGPVCEHLVPLLDGRRTVHEIVDALQGRVPARETYFALLYLEGCGYLAEGTPQAHAPEVEVAETALTERDLPGGDLAGTPGRRDRLRGARLGVTALGGLNAGPLAALLEAAGARVGLRSGEVPCRGDTLHLVLTPDYLDDALAAVNRQALADGVPLLLVKPAPSPAWIGPLLLPGETGCWACLAHRLHANRPADVFLKTLPAATPATHHRPEAIAPAVYGRVVTTIARWLNRDELPPRAVGALLTFDDETLREDVHRLVRRPQCPHCGDGDAWQRRQARPPLLVPRRKAFTSDGGHRTIPPAETYDRYQHHISPLTGAIRTLKRADTGTDPLTVSYVAEHCMRRQAYDMAYLRSNLRPRSGGKGRTDEQARTSGLCEALERYSGVFQGDEIRRTAPFTALGAAAVHPNACMHVSAAQYADRERWNAALPHACHRVPEPFDPDADLEWTPLWSLTEQTFKYLPTAYCYFEYTGPGATSCPADSNGNAAGNTLEEAVLQGFLELVERDGVGIWWYNRLRKPEVDLATFDDPYFQAVRGAYRARRRNLWVLDVTNDLGIPTFAAVSNRCDAPSEDILLGFGAHFDPHLALSRALTELNQVLPAAADADPPDAAPRPGSDADVWYRATVANQPYLTPDPAVAPRRREDFAYQGCDDLLEDIRTCIRIAETHQMEVLVLDQTRPDIGLHVVKVVVPGLRHFWRRLGPGRLFDIPVMMREIPEPLDERQLNPISLSY